MNFNRTIDWEFTVSGAVFNASETISDIMMASAAKKLSDHYIYARYTPGYRKSFILNSDTLVSIGDSVKVLNSNLNYSEKFGFGYSYQILPNLNAGISVRYFEQSYSQDNIYFYFSDTINTFVTITDEWDKKHFRGDFGFSYQPWSNLLTSVSTYNLVIFGESGGFPENQKLELNTESGAIFGIDYNPLSDLFFLTNIETSGSFVLGANYGFSLLGGILSTGFSIFHDNYQTNYISGFQPSINYSYRSFNFNITAIIYSDDRNGPMYASSLLEDGIHNIINNQYSYNSIQANLNLALNFKPEKNVKFIDIKIIEDIYPTLSEEYLTKPFAIAKVANVSDKNIYVKPSSYIESANDENVYSPTVSIAVGDTGNVEFYTLLSEDILENTNRRISQVNFYLATEFEEHDDQFQKPILINDRNSWDGKVQNLRYFVKSEISFSNKHSKSVLNSYSPNFESEPSKLRDFERIKILFNEFVMGMKYVSDPRASQEYVQFPSETIQLKGGDCDDLSVAFSSLLESIGIQTAFVDYHSKDGISHVNILINTELSPSEAGSITTNEKKYFVRKNVIEEDQVWIPLEMTSLTDFRTAWQIGSEKFYREAINDYGLSKGNVIIYDIY